MAADLQSSTQAAADFSSSANVPFTSSSMAAALPTTATLQANTQLVYDSTMQPSASHLTMPHVSMTTRPDNGAAMVTEALTHTSGDESSNGSIFYDSGIVATPTSVISYFPVTMTTTPGTPQLTMATAGVLHKGSGLMSSPTSVMAAPSLLTVPKSAVKGGDLTQFTADTLSTFTTSLSPIFSASLTGQGALSYNGVLSATSPKSDVAVPAVKPATTPSKKKRRRRQSDSSESMSSSLGSPDGSPRMVKKIGRVIQTVESEQDLNTKVDSLVKNILEKFHGKSGAGLVPAQVPVDPGGQGVMTSPTPPTSTIHQLLHTSINSSSRQPLPSLLTTQPSPPAATHAKKSKSKKKKAQNCHQGAGQQQAGGNTNSGITSVATTTTGKDNDLQSGVNQTMLSSQYPAMLSSQVESLLKNPDIANLLNTEVMSGDPQAANRVALSHQAIMQMAQILTNQAVALNQAVVTGNNALLSPTLSTPSPALASPPSSILSPTLPALLTSSPLGGQAPLVSYHNISNTNNIEGATNPLSFPSNYMAISGVSQSSQLSTGPKTPIAALPTFTHVPSSTPLKSGVMGVPLTEVSPIAAVSMSSPSSIDSGKTHSCADSPSMLSHMSHDHGPPTNQVKDEKPFMDVKMELKGTMIEVQEIHEIKEEVSSDPTGPPSEPYLTALQKYELFMQQQQDLPPPTKAPRRHKPKPKTPPRPSQPEVPAVTEHVTQEQQPEEVAMTPQEVVPTPQQNIPTVVKQTQDVASVPLLSPEVNFLLGNSVVPAVKNKTTTLPAVIGPNETHTVVITKDVGRKKRKATNTDKLSDSDVQNIGQLLKMSKSKYFTEFFNQLEAFSAGVNPELLVKYPNIANLMGLNVSVAEERYEKAKQILAFMRAQSTGNHGDLGGKQTTTNLELSAEQVTQYSLPVKAESSLPVVVSSFSVPPVPVANSASISSLPVVAASSLPVSSLPVMTSLPVTSLPVMTSPVSSSSLSPMLSSSQELYSNSNYRLQPVLSGLDNITSSSSTSILSSSVINTSHKQISTPDTHITDNKLLNGIRVPPQNPQLGYLNSFQEFIKDKSQPTVISDVLYPSPPKRVKGGVNSAKLANHSAHINTSQNNKSSSLAKSSNVIYVTTKVNSAYAQVSSGTTIDHQGGSMPPPPPPLAGVILKEPVTPPRPAVKAVLGDSGAEVDISDMKVKVETSPLVDRLRSNQQEEVPQCDCALDFDESREGPYYTHLGAGRNIAEIRHIMEQRSGLTGKSVRIEKVLYTGKEGKNPQGCPIAKWIIRRSGPEEKLLVVVRPRKGHSCVTSVMVIGICVWDGVIESHANTLYDYLRDVLPKYGNETERRCGTNEEPPLILAAVPMYRSQAHQWLLRYQQLQRYKQTHS